MLRRTDSSRHQLPRQLTAAQTRKAHPNVHNNSQLKTSRATTQFCLADSAIRHRSHQLLHKLLHQLQHRSQHNLQHRSQRNPKHNLQFHLQHHFSHRQAAAPQCKAVSSARSNSHLKATQVTTQFRLADLLLLRLQDPLRERFRADRQTPNNPRLEKQATSLPNLFLVQ